MALEEAKNHLILVYVSLMLSNICWEFQLGESNVQCSLCFKRLFVIWLEVSRAIRQNGTKRQNHHAPPLMPQGNVC
jgi:hypothetical protein